MKICENLDSSACLPTMARQRFSFARITNPILILFPMVMEKLLTDDNQVGIVFRAGETATGTLLDVNGSRMLVELPGGRTGIITRKELFHSEDDEYEPGMEIEAMVLDPENELGLVVLSLRRASQEKVWGELRTIMDEERIIKVKISEANKGGLMATYKGLKAFLPVSQLMPVNYPRVDGANATMILQMLEAHVGKEFAVRVINVDRESGKIILSEKAAHQDQIAKTLTNLSEGDVLDGEVSGIVKFGIFVTSNGVEGLVHLSEIDWGHVSNPGKLYSLGDKVQVKVIGIDGDKLSFSIKQLQEDPWLEKVKDYATDQIVEGPVIRWNAQGVFIEVAPDVQGVFGLDQFGVEDHSELDIKEGEIRKGTIVSVQTDSHRLELKKLD